ncbi:hypothetical protein HY522_03230 [bacterium]|nr:hypothetical protein [bacterium]
MTGLEVVNKAREAKQRFGAKCSKFAGAVAVEIVKSALLEQGIPTSPRDVFVRGIPVEVDLVVPRDGQEPALALLYERTQVAAVVEVKTTGSFGESTLSKIRQDFSRFQENGLPYAYVTLEERRGYRWALTTDRMGFPCFTLAWHSVMNGPVDPTEEWLAFIRFLRECRRTTG